MSSAPRSRATTPLASDGHNAAAAARSRYTSTRRWSCRKDAGSVVVTGPRSMPATADALRSPVAIITIVSARRIVPIPIDSAFFGTREATPPNGPAFSARVESSRVTRCVRAASMSPGSLNPMCPFTPSPSSRRSSPPDGGDRFFVTFAFDVWIWRHTVEAVRLAGTEIDSRQQVLRQKSPEAAGVRRVETDEFIQQERRRVREVGLPCGMEPAQLRVGLDWRSASRQAKHEIRSATQRVSDASGKRSTGFRRSFEDRDVQVRQM